MGAVWLAEHSMLGRRAAIKVLHPEFSSRPEIVTRFFNEARAATAIGDPGIVQIFDFGRNADGSAYIVMELLDGEPLDRRLAVHGALGLSDALRIMRQVASTLGAAHAVGIVHRDLKPENVFIVRDPEVPGGERAKILDFGIAKLVGGHGGIKTHTKAVMGTPTYMSPEQCRGAGLVDQRSDVYSLGCMLFRLLVGRPPFDSDGVGEIIVMHMREPPPVPSSLRPGIPPAVDQLVLRCLAKDPAQRFGDGAKLASMLEGILQSSAQSTELGPNTGYAAPLIPTTLSAVAGASVAVRSSNAGRATVFAGLSVVLVGGIIAIVATRDGAGLESTDLERARAPVAVPQESVKVLPENVNPNAEVATRAKTVLIRFIAWSNDHRGAPCPDIATLGDVPRDPWGHMFRLTCVDQPGDQIVGAISVGPDGTSGTTDDIASWQLGRDVTDLVRGPRWIAMALPAEPGWNPDIEVKRQSAISSVKSARIKPPSIKPVEIKPSGISPAEKAPPSNNPAAGAMPKQVNRSKRVELDENGLPINR